MPQLQTPAASGPRSRTIPRKGMAALAPMFETALHLIRAWGELGAAGLALLAATFVVGALAFVPRPALCLLGGLVFGFSVMPIALIASTAGAVAAFPAVAAPVAVARSPGDRRPAAASGGRRSGRRRGLAAGRTAAPVAHPRHGDELHARRDGHQTMGVRRRHPARRDAVGAGVRLSRRHERHDPRPESVSHAHLAFLAAGLVAVALAAWLIARKAKAILRRPFCARAEL